MVQKEVRLSYSDLKTIAQRNVILSKIRWTDLDEDIEHNVEVAAVNEHVSQESPNLGLLIWIEYQWTLKQSRAY